MFGIKLIVTADSSVMPDLGNGKYIPLKSGSIPWWKHKHWEIQISQFGGRIDTIFSIHLDLALNGSDHAGPKFCLELFGYVLDMQIYDDRHWNYEKNRWYLPGEEKDA